jgi:ribose-phosphate pyrophosphokinase
MAQGIKIFAGRASYDIAERIAKTYGTPLGDVKVMEFSDGEFQPSFEETVRGQDVFIVQSTIPPSDNLFELLLMIDAAKRASARKIIAVIPYLGLHVRIEKTNLACSYWCKVSCKHVRRQLV